jgi:hypothetical protein
VDPADPVMLAAIRRAAALVTIAEWHRTEAFKGGDVLLDDLVRVERVGRAPARPWPQARRTVEPLARDLAGTLWSHPALALGRRHPANSIRLHLVRGAKLPPESRLEPGASFVR